MAASRIQGITIEIGGDTTKLSKALSGVNKDIKSTETQLKDVERLLKLDPKNTELLAQKQKLLASAISDTKTKLKTLKEAEKQLKDSGVDKNSEQFQGLQREIIATEQDLKNLEEQAKSSSSAMEKIGTAGEALQSAGSKISAAGKKATVATTAIVGLGTAAVSTAASFDEEMSKVSAISGSTGDELQKLRDKAREMGSKTKFSASEAAQAMEYMAMAGWKTEDMLEGVDGVMNLAAASGSDLATTSDILTDALTGFGKPASDAGKLADIMAVTSSNANTNVEMMGETFKYVSSVAGAYGYKMEDVAEAIGLMANAGVKGSQAGTSLRSIMSRLATDAGASSKSLGALGTMTEKLGVEFYNSDGTMRDFNDVIKDSRKAWKSLSSEEAANTAKTIAGQEAMTAWIALMEASDEDVAKLESALKNADGTAESMATTMQDNLNGQLTILKSQLEELAISFGEVLMPMVRSAVSKIQAVVDVFNSLSDSQRNQIIQIAGVVAAVGPALIALGKVVSLVGSIMSAVSSLSGVLSGFGTFLSGAAGPIAIIGAIIALLVTLYNTNDDFKQGVDDLISDIMENLQPLLEFFQTDILPKLKEAWDTVAGALTEFGTAVMDFVVATFNDFLIPVIDNIVNTVLPPLIEVFKFLWQSVLSPMVDFISRTFSSVFSGVAYFFENTLIPLLGVLKEAFGVLWNGMLVPLCTFMSEVFGPVFEAVFETIGSLFDAFGDILSGLIDFVTGVFAGDWQRAWDGIKGILKGVLNGIISLVNLAIDGINWILTPIRWIIAQVGSLVGMNWSTDNVAIPHIPMLAKGGILSGGSAIVGERGPELLTVQGNQAKVQPLTNNTNNYTSSMGAVTINVYGAEGQDINDLADIISSKISNQYDRTRAAFA